MVPSRVSVRLGFNFRHHITYHLVEFRYILPSYSCFLFPANMCILSTSVFISGQKLKLYFKENLLKNKTAHRNLRNNFILMLWSFEKGIIRHYFKVTKDKLTCKLLYYLTFTLELTNLSKKLGLNYLIFALLLRSYLFIFKRKMKIAIGKMYALPDFGKITKNF